MVTLDYNVAKTSRPTFYWHFNVKLLQDADFFEKICSFWEIWRQRKNNFENLTQWWEVGKAQIKVFCQKCSYNATATMKRNVKMLEFEINEMEKRMIDVVNDGSVNI